MGRDWRSPRTPLGRLQRGRGQSHRDLTAVPRLRAWDWLLECLHVDYRWDRELEDRDGYHGDLAWALDLPLDPLAAALRQARPDDPGQSEAARTILVLLRLLRRGREAAGALLREYVTYGFQIEELLHRLHEVRPDLLDGLDEVIVARLDELNLTPHCAPEEVLATWCARQPRLAAAYAELRQQHVARPPKHPEWQDAAVPLSAILAEVDADSSQEASHRVWEMVTPADCDTLLAALDPASPWRTVAALAGLTRVVWHCHVPALVELAQQAPPIRILWFHLRSCLARVDCQAALPLARRWWNDADDCRHSFAAAVLRRAASSEDLPLVLAGLARLPDPEDYGGHWPFFSCLAMAARLPADELLPYLRAAYEGLCSNGRSVVAETMIATMPEDFAARYAEECLWDCEWRTRDVAADALIAEVIAPEALQQQLRDPLFDEW